MNLIKQAIKLLKCFWNFKTGRKDLTCAPVRLWIESSLVCNLKCTMCPNKDIPNSDKGMMELSLFKKIIDEAADFVSDIYLHHRGEPLVHPDLFEMIRYARERGIRVRFHTNATLLTPEKAEKLLEARPELISISFDGFQKDIYEAVRQGGNFEKTLENIIGLLELKKKSHSKLPYIIVERIDFPRYESQVRVAETEKVGARLQELGLDELIVKKEYTWVTDEAPDLADKKVFSQCTFPWYAMVICWDGTVTPCPQDYKAGIRLGNVKDKSLKEIWNDAPYQDLRERLLNNVGSLSLCRKCDRLCRKQIGGMPIQYLVTFVVDHLLGYGKLRKWIGSSERND